MAYQQDYNDDQDKQNQQATDAQTNNVGETSIGPSSAATNTSAGSANSSSQPSASTGTGYQNLDNYVKANQNQANQMATGITNDITKNLKSANAQKMQFTNDVRNYADQNTVKDSGVIGALGSNQSQFAGNKNLTDAYNKQLQGYQGNTDVSQFGKDYRDLSAKYANIDQTAKGLQSPGGIQGKLQDIYGAQNPNYTQGQQTLDSFLIGGASGNANIGNFLKSYEAQDNLGSFQNTMSGLNQDLGNAKATTEATKKATQGAYDSALKNYANTFNTDLQNLEAKNSARLSAAEANREKLRNLDSAALYNANISDLAAKYAKDHGVDLGTLIKGPELQKLGDFVDQGNVKNYQALLGLTPGKQAEFDLSKSKIDPLRSGSYYDQNVANQLENMYAAKPMSLRTSAPNEGVLAPQQQASQPAKQAAPAKSTVNPETTGSWWNPNESFLKKLKGT